MKVAPAGVPFEVGPHSALTGAERAALAGLPRTPLGLLGAPFRLDVRGSDRAHEPPSPPAPAAIRIEGEQLTLSHASFSAWLDLTGARGELTRPEDGAFPLAAVLRTALCCRLPLAGGLPLHAAGVIIDGRGVAFFGPSGAGKTTLARSSPHPVMSDELVAVAGAPWELRATGWWGELGERAGAPLTAPLIALVELAKGPTLDITPLSPPAAFRRLLDVLVLPRVPSLWHTAAAVLARLVSGVPVLRMAWNAAERPWQSVADTLRDSASELWANADPHPHVRLLSSAP